MRGRTGVALLILLLLAVNVGRAAAGEAAVLRRGNGSEPESLDPIKVESISASHIIDDLYEPLVTLDAADRPVPAAAASWQVSENGRVYTFRLRPGLRWSDGTPLTAQDFVYALRRALQPGSGAAAALLLYPIRNARDLAEGRQKDSATLGVEAVDAQTLRFTLDRPTPYWAALMAHGMFSPIKRASVEKFGDNFTRPGNLVTNGPFMLQEWTPQSRIVLVKNPYYRDAANVHVDKVIFYPIESEAEEFNRYRAGELDVTYQVPSRQLDLIRQNMTGELRGEPSLTLDYIGFDMGGPPFAQSSKLRQALSMAIDRQALVDKVLRTGATVVYGAVPVAGVLDYYGQSAEWAWLSSEEKVAKARQLYREAGYGDRHPLEVELYTQASDNVRKVAQTIIAQWQQALGVKATLVSEDFPHFVEHRHQRKDMRLFWFGWIADYPDATTFLNLFTSKSPDNDFQYRNPAFDQLLEEAESVVDLTRRGQILQKAEEMLIADNPVIPLFTRVNPYLAKPWVKGYHINPCGYVYDKEVTLLPH
jgi:oligopeptide transport system substrate-binding protein